MAGSVKVAIVVVAWMLIGLSCLAGGVVFLLIHDQTR